jgi:hypothetical protein
MSWLPGWHSDEKPWDNQQKERGFLITYTKYKASGCHICPLCEACYKQKGNRIATMAVIPAMDSHLDIFKDGSPCWRTRVPSLTSALTLNSSKTPFKETVSGGKDSAGYQVSALDI